MQNICLARIIKIVLKPVTKEFDPGNQITLEYRYFNGPEINKLNVSGDERIEDQPIDYDYHSQAVMIGMKFGL